jgi:hypothetical protein
MAKTIKARVHDGKIEPLEPLHLAEGSEIVIAVTRPAPCAPVEDAATGAAGTAEESLDGNRVKKEHLLDQQAMMATDKLIVQIKGLEAQLAVLKAHLTRLRTPAPPRTLADLEGILASGGDFTEEEIDAVLYRFDWEGEEF